MNLKCDFCSYPATFPVTLDCCLFTTCYEHFENWSRCGICQTRVDHHQTLSKLKNRISHNINEFKHQHDLFRILLDENKSLKHDPSYFISSHEIFSPTLQNWLYNEMDSVQLDPIENKTNEFIFDTLALSQTISDKLQLDEMIQRRLKILTDINKNFNLETKLLQNIKENENNQKQQTLAPSRKKDWPMASLRLTVNKFALNAKKDLIACSLDGRIDLVNSDLSTSVNKCSYKLSILCCALLLDNEMLAFGCSDGSIYFFDLKLNKITSTIKAHNADCTSILMLNHEILISASSSGEIISWNIHAKKKKKKVHPKKSLKLNFQGHSRAVNGLEKFGKSSFLSCSDDTTICLWKGGHFSAMQIMMGHEAKVTCLKNIKNNLFSGSCDGTVRMWNVSNAKCVKIFWPDDNLSSVLCLDGVLDRFLVLAMANGKIKCLEVASKKVMVSIDAHNEAITCLNVTNMSCVVTSSSDGFVKLWKLNTIDFNKKIL